MNSHQIINCPNSEGVSKKSERTSERSGAREQCGASEQVSGASRRANGRASGPVLSSGFLVDLAYCAASLPSFEMAGRTMVQNSIIILSHLTFTFPRARESVSEQASKQMSAAEHVSEASQGGSSK